MSERDHALLSSLPPWILLVLTFVVFLAYVLPRLAEASEAAAKLLGPIGSYWRDRGLRRAQAHRNEVQAEARQLAQEIVNKVTPPDYAEMGRRLENMDKRVRTLERSERLYKAYIVYDADWHFDDELAAVGHPDCKPAPRLSFDQFEELHDNGWRPGQPLPRTDA
ncbi:hypothetical protein [Mycolicibacterium sp.]|uniref:hypothetical protein n=1 Tax=Mycolicibacterium sp. TaxID=2320850 RepID=UPI00355FF0DB